MDTKRIIEAAKIIEDRTKALSWLERNGERLTGRNDAARVEVTHLAEDQEEGGYAAQLLIESYLKLQLPEAVKSAISCCGNDIDIARDTIAAQIDRGVA